MQLGFPPAQAARMKEIIASTARYLRDIKPEWYFARLHRNARLRLFCGHVVVLAAEKQHIWLALNESFLPASFSNIACWRWDEPESRPHDATDDPYPRYKRPPSRNGFYTPALDPEGQDWKTIKLASLGYIENACQTGRSPDHRTHSDPGLCEAIDLWEISRTSSAFDDRVHVSRTLSKQERTRRLNAASPIPAQRRVVTVEYLRNPDVVAEVLERANGVCERCGEDAPFTRRSDNTPYLEVHHKKRLADGGEDTVQNALALCPNCHRRLHFGRE